jgi:Ran GTPase-activating protein (RanGAP) involved in mRNA processing and transport
MNNKSKMLKQTQIPQAQISISKCGIYFDASSLNMTATTLNVIINRLGNIKIDDVNLNDNRLKDNKTTAKLIRKFFFQNLLNTHTINLSNNQLSSLVAKVFIEILAKFEKLKFLSLENNNFSFEDKERIHATCQNLNVKINF